jgi:glutamate racemase
VKIIVIACGTATSQALDIVKKEYDIPIFGIIEPTVEYVMNMNLDEVGIIATTGTIRNGAWEKSLKRKIKEIKVVNQACPLLAGIAEEGKAKSKESLNAVHEYMQIFKENKIKTIIMGCTHYPIYQEIIKKEFEYDITLINTGVAVANKIFKYVEQQKIENKKKKSDMPKIILTENISGFDEKVKKMLKFEY